ncbi:ABC transporter permease [Ruminococcaceae bacterium BL-6]|nr:ABC transporter permease [Ruminococcaceae bacterium BL-6]
MRARIERMFRGRAPRVIFAAAFWLILWQLLYWKVGQEILVVSPARVLQRLMQLGADGAFWACVGASLLRILAGYFLAVVCGTFLGAACSRFRMLYDLVHPLVGILRATPVASFIILALVWIKSARVPVFTAFLMVFPIVWENLYRGVRSADKSLLEMAESFHVGKLKKIRYLYFPCVLPHFTAACAAGMGLAWKAGIAAEVLANTRNSIGGQIYGAKIYLETADLFAWTAVVVVMSVLLERLMLRLIGRFSGQRDRSEGNFHGD